LQIRVGLNSGEVVVRAIGNDLTMDYDAIGQTTHLAGRMEQLAIPGTIRLTSDTLRLAEGFVEVGSLGPVPVKGLKSPVEVFELTGATSTQTRFQATVARGLSRFVGRQTELEALGRALGRAGDSHGQVVAVVGEPGVGKSRLFYEFTHSHRTEHWLVLQSGSVSYGKATPYLPVIDLLRSYFQVEDRDEARRVREKVTGKLLTLDESLKPMLPAFLSLLDAPVEDAAWDALDPSQRRRRTFDAVKGLLLREGREQPLVLVFEDLHWIDTETQAFLDSLVESLPTARFLLLVNYRPEYRHGWGSKTYYTQRRIDPLPAESAEELLAALLGENTGLAPLKQLLIEQTGGNPFFLEECIRTLIETGALTGSPGDHQVAADIEQVEVPATVQGVLAARIDRLPMEDKQLLQTSAVIGKDVPYTLLQAIGDAPEDDLRRGLVDLQAAEFLYETRLFPDLEYTFKHALTHEVAYGSLLQKRRRKLHRRIAEAIETVYGDRLAEQLERLAHHCTEAGLTEQAVGYWQRAGHRAIEHSANTEAIAHLTKGLELLDTLPETAERSQRELTLQITLGVPLQAIKGPASPDVERTYGRARELCWQAKHAPEHFTALWGLWRFHVAKANFSAARKLAEELFNLAQRQQDPALVLQAHHAQWATLYDLGEFGAALEHTKQGIALYDRQEHHTQAYLFGGHDPCVCAHGHAALPLWSLGYPDQAVEMSLDALTLADELSHPISMAHALRYALKVRLYRRDTRAVQERVDTFLALSTEQNFVEYLALGTFMHGWVQAQHGQSEAGIAGMRQGIATGRATGKGAEEANLLGALAEALGKTGAAEEGLRLLNEALAAGIDSGMTYWDAELHRLKGELLLSQSAENSAEAEASYNQAIAVASRQQAKSLELRAATSLARLLQGQCKHAEARELLEPVYDWFTEGFDTSDLKDAKALLDELA
jgi:predicted ATPase